MRMMVNCLIPHEPFNTLVRQGKAGQIIGKILDELKPEATYFSEWDGKRNFIVIVDVADPSRIPSIAEPFFLSFNADCRFQIVMSGEELGRAGLEDLGRRWS